MAKERASDEESQVERTIAWREVRRVLARSLAFLGTPLGSAYLGTTLGVALGAGLAIVEPWPETLTGPACAAVVIGGAAGGPVLYLAASRWRSRQGHSQLSTQDRRGHSSVSDGTPSELATSRRRPGLLSISSILIVVAGLSACGTETASSAHAAEFIIGQATDPLAVCGSLFPGEVISRYLGYQAPSGVSLSRSDTSLAPHTGGAGGWSLDCGFTENGNPTSAYHVIVSPAVKHGPSGLVKANGVTVSGVSRGIVPAEEKHLIPLFGGATTRVGFST